MKCINVTEEQFSEFNAIRKNRPQDRIASETFGRLLAVYRNLSAQPGSVP